MGNQKKKQLSKKDSKQSETTEVSEKQNNSMNKTSKNSVSSSKKEESLKCKKDKDKKLNCQKNLQIEFSKNEENGRVVKTSDEGLSDHESVMEEENSSRNSNTNATALSQNKSELANELVRSPRDLMKFLKRKKVENSPKATTPKRKKFTSERDLDLEDEQEMLDYDDEVILNHSMNEEFDEREEEMSDLSDDECTERIVDIPEPPFLGESSKELQAENERRNSRSMEDYISQLVAKEIESRMGTKKAKNKKKVDHKDKGSNLSNKEITQEIIKNLTEKLKGGSSDEKGKNKTYIQNKLPNKIKRANEIIKSPSDLTMYSPALQKRDTSQIREKHSLDLSNWFKQNGQIGKQQSDRGDNNFVDNFLESVRASMEGNEVKKVSKTREEELAKEAILNAERFKADIHSSGMNNENSVPPVDLNFDDNKDEEFSEGTCHVDQPSIVKICNGQFMEVAKLIPKQQAIKTEENKRLEFVNCDGMTYYIPSAAEKEQKIYNVRKWEQGFKVYAAIYSKANPHRAAEIWQYIHTINLAASSYHWDNVAYYDFMFRQQMAKYPQRSWRKINHQLWSLAMRDPISSKSNYNNNNQNSGSHSGCGRQDFKENTCWRYNRNKCNRSKQECRIEH